MKNNNLIYFQPFHEINKLLVVDLKNLDQDFNDNLDHMQLVD